VLFIDSHDQQKEEEVFFFYIFTLIQVVVFDYFNECRDSQPIMLKKDLYRLMCFVIKSDS